MPPNLLAGAGPQGTSGGAGAPAPMQPAPGGPLQAPPNNMLSQGGPSAPPMGAAGPGAPPQSAPVVPPSPEMMKEALTKQSMMTSSLKQLLSKPDLSTKDILDEVGEMVAEQVLSPFMAAKSLSDLPPDGDSLKLRQWVGQHYANATKSFQTISSMLAAHGAMMRQQGAAPPMQEPPQAPTPQPSQSPPANQFSGAQ